MKWIAIAGTWKLINDQVESDVRSAVKELTVESNGIVTGGALGVDYIATDEILKVDPIATRIKIFLPCTLERYVEHYRKRAEEGVISSTQAETLIEQLKKVHTAKPKAIIENTDTVVIDKVAYFNRITHIVDEADELYAFQVNKSEGTQDTINKAKKKGIPVKLFAYTFE